MRRGHRRQDPARRGERGGQVLARGPELVTHGAQPHVRLGRRVVEQPAPDAEAVGVFLPVPARVERGVGVGAAATCLLRTDMPRAAASLERQRLHDLDAGAVAEREGARVSRGEDRVAPDEQSLRAGPDAVHDAPPAALAEEIAVAVAGEATRTGAELHEAGRLASGLGALLLADVGLVVGQAEVLGPVPGRDRHGRAGGERRVDHVLIHALGVHVDLDGATTRGDTLEDGFPELVAALLDAALAMHAERDAADLWHLLQEQPHRVATIRPVRLGGEPLDGGVRVWAGVPFVAVHPQPELELQAARRRLARDEPQHLEVAVALGVGELRHAHVVAGHREQEWIAEDEVCVGDVGEEVVADPQREVEAVEALPGQHREIRGPHLAVVEPGLVFDVAREQARDAADAVGRPFGHWPAHRQRSHRVGRQACPIGELEKRVGQAARVMAAGPHPLARLAERERIRLGDRPRTGVPKRRRGGRKRQARREDAEPRGGRICGSRVHGRRDAALGERAHQLLDRPSHRRRRRHRGGGIHDDGNRPRLR